MLSDEWGVGGGGNSAQTTIVIDSGGLCRGWTSGGEISRIGNRTYFAFFIENFGKQSIIQ